MALHLQLTLDGSSTTPPDRVVVDPPPAALWPFLYPFSIELPDEPSIVRVPDLHEAFVNHQTASTRLVTTQATYLFLTWMELAGNRDVTMVATADRASIGQHAPEILGRTGIFTELCSPLPMEGGGLSRRQYDHLQEQPRLKPRLSIGDSDGDGDGDAAGAGALLAQAMRAEDARKRLELCVRALDEARSPATLLAAASVCMEVNDLDGATRDLDEAISLASQWAAAQFELGKLWLRRDDMERASAAFRAAAERMPRFASAWSNLGATLGELDRPQEALAAFDHALEAEPASANIHNNIGVVSRELGRLAESEAAFRRAIELAPTLAFGFYNLGHTLFLQGRYQAALTAYAEGQKRDPERNAVQATRLALCRLATGDPQGALADLRRATAALPPEYRRQLLADTSSIAWALLTHRPDLPGWDLVNGWLMRELG